MKEWPKEGEWHGPLVHDDPPLPWWYYLAAVLAVVLMGLVGAAMLWEVFTP